MIANVFLAQTVISLLVFSVFTASGGTLTAKRLFTTLSMVNHVRVTGMAFTSRAAFTFSGARVAVSRIQVDSSYTQGLGWPSQGLGWPSQGLGWPSQGLGWPSQGLGWPSQGLGWPAQGLGWPSQGLGWPS